MLSMITGMMPKLMVLITFRSAISFKRKGRKSSRDYYTFRSFMLGAMWLAPKKVVEAQIHSDLYPLNS
ncbi:hypothetical protein R2601_27349 [Salipiger bermudensis HTCC2601]|uniref:Uncharacterized protein n=1 Tax=Salipiger bermudensis (strain DSM 26914 / JCM 13377 / KCTC 12554 / HTCC2601) TaxID=314265 RepID=Q0FGW4_SALBH|nr:hypothetical protein R2601_27349 [Salipiger bermudensis HTCC2601]